MNPEDDLEALATDLASLMEIADLEEERLHGVVPEVSRWSPAQQAQHAARALFRMLAAVRMLQAGEDARILPAGDASVEARALLEGGLIPRGRVQALTPTVPQDRPEGLVDDLRALLLQVRALAPHADVLASVAGRLPHPALGPLDAPQWLAFAAIHTRHHLGIARSILAPES